ncbi:hypothetical protein BU23DRAFT_573394 [Bimuria novae-zelandiae CBS 107.79]|uniref:Uncharacterized protein n=1 Tax=Bimuria novae-zelandiae CBS 107.79 TaxID=1447943 RepID=A0A6A5US65_9PLEO|nr:hypothetical protein BU23DRAFT_573394 [Bimuria novae-zelandiae CBS 107.79]
MATGYVIEITIYVAVVAAFAWLHISQNPKQQVAKLLLANATKTFFDSALFYTFSIQLASTITLAQANFGVTADGMEAITMKIAWTVSTMTLLPLLKPAIFVDTGLPSAKSRAREGERFLLFVLCWMVSYFPFFSQMAGTFGRSQIGDNAGAVISSIDWNKIYDACFSGVETLSEQDQNAMLGFGITSWLVIIVIVVSWMIISSLKEQLEKVTKIVKDGPIGKHTDRVRTIFSWSLLNFVVLLLLLGQLWTFFRLQRFQRGMVLAAGRDPADNHWSFGQIVSVVLFMPVLVEVMFLWKRRSLYVSINDSL